MTLRQDTGNLWENFLISERIKYLNSSGQRKNLYFWRTHEKNEIDLIEEYGGHISGYKLKTKTQKYKVPGIFKDAYPEVVVELISRENYMGFIS